jgi:arsenite-transporting ATPase
MRIIVFSGKGGSGASTVAAGTACLLAEAGNRTLAFGLNRGLGAAFGQRLGPRPAAVANLLDAAEGHAGPGGKDDFRDWLQGLLNWRGMDAELADDLASLPGINHIGRLLELEALVSSEVYDTVVLDAATLTQYLDLPAALDAAARWLDRLFAPRQQNVFEPLVRAFAGDYAAAGEAVFETGQALLGRLADFRDTLTDPEITTVRLVATADQSSLDEVRDAVSVFSLFQHTVDAVIAGRLLPDTISDPLFQSQLAEQKAILAALGELAVAPLILAPHEAPPPRGPEPLAAFARAVYGGRDPAGFFADAGSHSVTREADHYLLRVHIPFARREELRLEDTDDGIAVHLNGRRCVIVLPEDVLYSEAASWTYDDPILHVVLER